jgi:hypothetical protein
MRRRSSAVSTPPAAWSTTAIPIGQPRFEGAELLEALHLLEGGGRERDPAQQRLAR